MKCPRCKLHHSWSWTRDGKLCDPPFEEECDDDDNGSDLFELMDTDLFHFDGALEYCCVTCGATRFRVGSLDYQTILKCERCGWESTTHEG